MLMKSAHRFSIAAGCLLCLAQATTTHAQAYLTPSAGYQSAYNASSQLSPDQQPGTMAAPLWTSNGYTASNATVQQEGGSGQWMLSLDNTATSGQAKFANYLLDSGTGSGTNSDLITVDFRFQLTGSSLSSPQLSLGIARPLTALQAANGETNHSYNLTFGQLGIGYLNPSGGSSFKFKTLGQTWHDARLAINTRLADARLYLDGSTTPTLAFSGGTIPSGSSINAMSFGDGSSSVTGSANIASLRWTNNDMAIPLTGGQVNILKTSVVDANAKDMNFTFAHRFTDGTISLSHSVGQHQVDETSAVRISHDNGLTWQTPPPTAILPTGSSTNLPGGGAAMVNRYDADASAHTQWGLMTYKWNSSTAIPTQTLSSVTFPFATGGMIAHRSLVTLDNGNWVASTYGSDSADPSVSRVYAIGSSDQGQTWSYLSTIGTGNGPTGEGYNEPSIVKLADGSLLALLRTDNTQSGPLMQAKSTDGGSTWSAPVQVADYGVDPDVIRLQNGALVASSGRPGVFIMVDMSGTGDYWQEVPMYSGVGSGYTTLVELEPNLVGMFYDESGFNGAVLDPALLPNKVLLTTFSVQGVPEPTALALAMLGGSALLLKRPRYS
jgi:hypothetical protein